MRVDVAVLQEAFADADMSYSRAATNMGLIRRSRQNGRRGDSTHFKRMIGLAPYKKGERRYTVKTVSYDRAVAIIEALGLDPLDYGL